MKKTEQDLLKKVADIVTQCDRCGSCLTVCPLFGTRDIESSSARGKNNLARGLLAGVVAGTKELLAATNFCLLCRACVANCPNKVATDEAMIHLRQHLSETVGGAHCLKYKAVGTLMKHRPLVKLSAGAIGLVRKAGLNRLIPFGMAPKRFTREQYLQAFAAGPAVLGRPAAAADITVSPQTKVAYFKGCGMQMMFPEAVAETITILKTITKPQWVDNVCCGLPHLAHGLRTDFLKLAKENIRLFESAEIVITDCASCSDMLKHTARYLAEEPEWQQRAADFSGKIMGLTEYLAKVGYQPRQRTAVTLTFHEPCHLGRGQGIRKQPRELLAAAANYVEMAGADTCCGGAGTFHTDYPGIADALLAKKQKNIENAGAELVVTECPTCLVQLKKAAQRSDGKFQALHISQVL